NGSGRGDRQSTDTPLAFGDGSAATLVSAADTNGDAAGGPLLRIAHVLSSFGMGGQERVALDLATEQVREGHRVIAISIAPLPHGVLADAFAQNGIAVHGVSKGRGLDPRVVLGLARLLRREAIDVVHTHNPQSLAYGAAAGRLVGTGVIHT